LAEEPTGVALEFHLRWTGAEETPVILANQFIGQVGQQNEVVLTFGQVVLPALLGDAEQQTGQLKDIPEVPIKTLARLGLTRDGLDELIRVLELTRTNYEKAQDLRNAGEI
jgi:hypothetical protein